MITIPSKYVNNPEKVGSFNILGLAGLRKSGKSFCAKIITSLDPRFKEISFAESLKKLYSEKFNVPEDELNDITKKEKHRRGLQSYSLELKNEYGEFVFVNRLIKDLDPLQYYVISDVRFLCELQTILILGGVSYKVYADNYTRSKRGWTYDSRVDDDISEIEVGDLSSDTFYKCCGGSFIYNTKDESYLTDQLQIILKNRFPVKIDYEGLNRLKDLTL